MKKAVSLLLLAGVFCAALSACGGTSERLLGYWACDQGDRRRSLEFFSDGTFVADGDSGVYTAENERLKLQYPEKVFVYDYAVGRERLYLTKDGVTMEFQKIRQNKP